MTLHSVPYQLSFLAAVRLAVAPDDGPSPDLGADGIESLMAHSGRANVTHMGGGAMMTRALCCLMCASKRLDFLR